MKKLIKTLFLSLISAIFTLTLAACGSETFTPDSPVSLAVVYSRRAGNSTSAYYFDARLDGDRDTLLYRACAPQSEIITVTSSGSPFQSAPIIIPQNEAVTAAQSRDDRYYFAETSKKTLISTQANAPEADTFSALKIAAGWLQSQPDDYPKYCLIIDNGICTTGTLSFFQDGFLTAEPEEIVHRLVDKGSLPNLDGVTVVFAGLGRTSLPQEEPGAAAQARLEKLWSLIVTESGGMAVISPDKFGTEEEVCEYSVSAVKFPPDQPMKFDPKIETSFEKAVFLGEDQVRFIEDSAEYFDEDKAGEVIFPIAGFMKENPAFTMLVAGTTAGDVTTDFCLDLSWRRAEKVKETLVSFGAPEERIVTLGLGSSDPWHIYGVGITGETAAQNRKVVLLDASSSEAATLIVQNEIPK